MPNIRDTVYSILRQHGITTIFGNPGSNELPFLSDFPDDFRYILGLHEGVVLGMADGYAQASGQPAFVNLHAAAGTGNAVGALTNAATAHSPVIVSAGQQVRDTVGIEPLLANIDAILLPRPLVKWSGEPLSATAVPHTIARAIHEACLAPRGPVYVSIPYDDWDRETDLYDESLGARRVRLAGGLPETLLAELKQRLDQADNPVLVLGPDVDADRAQASAVTLAERLKAPVWVAPSAPRCPYPTSHPAFRGLLPAGIQAISSLLAGHDLVVAIGAPVFRYHQYDPGQWLPEGAELLAITCDPDEAARAPMGDAIVADVGTALAQLATAVSDAGRPMPAARAAPTVPTETDGPLAPANLFHIVNELAPAKSVFLNESTSTTPILWQYLQMDAPGSYYFCPSGGLGFAMPAAIGVQLAEPERTVIALVGDGSAQYAIQSLWTAVQHKLPVKYVILRNSAYGALQWFAGVLGVKGIPSLCVDGIDFCALARGYGMTAFAATSAAEFRQTLADALAYDGPALVEVDTVGAS